LLDVAGVLLDRCLGKPMRQVHPVGGDLPDQVVLRLESDEPLRR